MERRPARFEIVATVVFVAWSGIVQCGGQGSPPPKVLPYIAVELPSSARAYEVHDLNITHPITQVRFEIDHEDVTLLEGRLPCRLGPVEVGPPKHAIVARNEQPWYRPELATRHRGCDYEARRGDTSSSFLVDVSHSDKAVVYVVLAYYWNPTH